MPRAEILNECPECLAQQAGWQMSTAVLARRRVLSLE
jgi:hypothetical protein